jgi:hypothetical protein
VVRRLELNGRNSAENFKEFLDEDINAKPEFFEFIIEKPIPFGNEAKSRLEIGRPDSSLSRRHCLESTQSILRV